MISRILITGKNNTIPMLRDLKVCASCGGDGWVHGWGNNPSERPFRVTCSDCNGEGAIERKTPAYDATAGQWLNPPSGMTPDAGASAEPGHSGEDTLFSATPLSQGPAAVPFEAAGFWEAVVDGVTTALGLVAFGLVAAALWVLA